MQRPERLLAIGWIVATLAVCPVSAVAQGKKGGGSSTPPFSVVPLADVSGTVHGMNDAESGIVELVGVCDGGDSDAAVYWSVFYDDNGTTVTSRVLPSLNTTTRLIPRGINNEGVIAGHEYTGVDQNTPLAWSSGLATAPVALPVPDLFEPDVEDENAYVGGISNDGLIVGFVRQTRNTESLEHLIIWKFTITEGEVEVLDTLVIEQFGDSSTYPSVSRTGGFVAFSDRLPGQGLRALRLQVAWDEAEELLYEVPGSRVQLLQSNSYASDVNSSATVVGTWNNGSGTLNNGYAIDAVGTLLSIPTLPSFRLGGTKFTYHIWHARGVNQRNEVLTYQWGMSSYGSLARHADAVCIPGGSAIDLSTYSSNWLSGSATAINNDGLIAGRLQTGSGINVPALIIR